MIEMVLDINKDLYKKIDNEGRVILSDIIKYYECMDTKDIELENKLKTYIDQIRHDLSLSEFRQMIILANSDIGLNTSRHDITVRWIEYLKKVDDKFIDFFKETILIAKMINDL